MDAAEKLSQLVADHPAVARYKSAQKAVSEDPEAGRMLADFDRQIETLGRQEQQGVPVTEVQRQQLETLQSRIVSHIKIKNLDLLRKVNQTIQRPLSDAGSGAAGGPALAARA
jgi:cell fate (sporulation/competence/biofilm development) regulator YlbF (YheA/YmcA/DUF963 family)